MATVVPLRRAIRMVKEENARSQYSIVLVTFSPQRKQKLFPQPGQSLRLRSHEWKDKRREGLRRKRRYGEWPFFLTRASDAGRSKQKFKK